MAISQSLPTTDPAFHLNFQGARRLDPRVTFTRASIATYVDEDGLVKTAGVNQARFTYDPATGESLGLLIEESRTNLYQNSQNIQISAPPNYGNWATSSVTTNTVISPDGTLTADTITPQVPSASIVQRFNATAGTTYTFSIYLKRNPSATTNIAYFGFFVAWSNNGTTRTNNYTFSLLGPGSETFPTSPLTDEWKRFSFSYTCPVGAISMEMGVSNRNAGSGSPGYSVYAWGAQIEQGSFPTSYIPTSGSAVTRSVDTAIFASQEISSEGTLLSLGGGSPSSPASYNSSEVNTSTSVITLNSQLSDSSTLPTLLYYPEPISGDAIKAMRAYAPIVKDGLVLHLDAGVDKSYPNAGTIWRDLSGQGNHGTLVNGPTYDGGNGGSLVFDGTNDRVTIVNSVPSLSNLTIELFLQAHILDGSQDIFLDQLGSLRCELQSNKFNIHLGSGNGWFFTWQPSNTVLSPNIWYHFAWTWSSSTTTSRIYVNGVEDADPLIYGAAASSSTGDITLGQHTPDTTYNWNGKMSSVKIYNRALSSTEILQNFNASRSRFNI